MVIVHRPLDPHTAEHVAAHQAAGASVLVDEDDDLTSVPASNPWRPSPDTVARHEAAIAAADGLIVTTPALANRYGPLARRTFLVPNYLPDWVGAIRSHCSSSTVRVGWAGAVVVHRDDLEWLAPHAGAALADATFSTVGDVETLRILRLAHHAHEYFPYQDTAEALYKLMARADIGIVPLVPGPFNEAKSWLKALEHMSLGKPVVASDLPEQRRLITHGVNGFLAATASEFADYVQLLVTDADLRTRMGQAARAHTRALTLELQGHVWDQLVTDALTTATATVDAGAA